MRKFLDSILNWVAKNFSDDVSKMLIWTGVAGWTLSSAAQMCAILFNPKIPNEQKSYLLPQEVADAAVNIGSFFAVTQIAKHTAAKLFKTGKFAPKSVKEFIKNNKTEIGEKIGKLDFNLEDFLKSKNASCLKDYQNTFSNNLTNSQFQLHNSYIMTFHIIFCISFFVHQVTHHMILLNFCNYF